MKLFYCLLVVLHARLHRGADPDSDCMQPLQRLETGAQSAHTATIDRRKGGRRRLRGAHTCMPPSHHKRSRSTLRAHSENPKLLAVLHRLSHCHHLDDQDAQILHNESAQCMHDWTRCGLYK